MNWKVKRIIGKLLSTLFMIKLYLIKINQNVIKTNVHKGILYDNVLINFILIKVNLIFNFIFIKNWKSEWNKLTVIIEAEF